ncbi:hypothetical protein AB0B93_00200 [Streptomyces lavendulae]|nr:hypothetical protein [Streptomyces lavendulae]
MEEDVGREAAALTIARYMVVFLRRADSEAQFSTLGHGAGANLLVAPPALSTRLSPRSASASPPMENPSPRAGRGSGTNSNRLRPGQLEEADKQELVLRCILHHWAMESGDDLRVVLVTLDRDAAAAVLTRSDGKEARFPFRSPVFEPSSMLARIAYPPTFEGLFAQTREGDAILFELPRYDAASRLNGRLVVYLDQNKWRPVSDVLQGRDAGARADREAASRLVEWVEQGRVILPASAGHYYETTKWSNAEGRHRLGLAVLQLSRGWQLRDPLQVRRDELRWMFRNRVKPGAELPTAITLAPNVIHSAARGVVPPCPPADFPSEEAFQHEALVSATALIDVMLDSVGGERGPETGWTQANQRFSDWLDGQGSDSQKKRKSIDVWLLQDLQREVAEESYTAGWTAGQLKDWASDSQSVQELGSLPSLGLFREMLHERHLNQGTTWKPNDVIDMVYLSCAAGYADFVVCERQMREPLARGIKRLGRRTQVFRSLPQAVAAISVALEVVSDS